MSSELMRGVGHSPARFPFTECSNTGDKIAGATMDSMQRREFMQAAAGLAGAALAGRAKGAAKKEWLAFHDGGGAVSTTGARARCWMTSSGWRTSTPSFWRVHLHDSRAGVQKPNFHGGNFAAVHPQYYKDTPLTPADMRATDFGDYDVLADMIPEARKRGMKTFCWVIEDNFRPRFGKTDEIWGRDLYGRIPERHPGGPCINNPGYRNFVTGLMEDYSAILTRSTANCGARKGKARWDPLWAPITNGAHSDPGRVACFCRFCEARASCRHRFRTRAGSGRYQVLEKFVRGRPRRDEARDGYFVAVLADSAGLSRDPGLGDAVDPRHAGALRGRFTRR